MTPEQEEQFSHYGCASRCLLAIANANGNAKTKAEFIDEFAPLYPHWETQCGATDMGRIIEIARKLGIGNNYTVLLGKGEVRKLIANKKVAAALLLTEKTMQPDGSFTPFYHCSLVAMQLPPGHGFHVAQVDNEIQILPAELKSCEAIDKVSGYFLLIS